MSIANDKSHIPSPSEKKSGVKPFFQPKLSVNQPGDNHEQEADMMADKVMRMTNPANGKAPFFQPDITGIQRKCQHCEEEEKLQRKESSDGEVPVSNELNNYVGSLGSFGQPLSPNSKSFFEPRFGHDFSDVRVHTNAVAAKSAQSINALAYTIGNNIVFNTGQFSPKSDSGKKLIAHELTHVVQQGKGISTKKIQRVMEYPKKGLDPWLTEAVPQSPNPITPAPKTGPLPSEPKPYDPHPYDSGPYDKNPSSPKPPDQPSAPAPPAKPCPLSITGPDRVDHYCNPYTPSDAQSCGIFPAKDIKLTVSGVAARAPIAWSISAGTDKAAIDGDSNKADVQIKGNKASAAKNDVTVSVSDGTCTATKTITVREPTSLNVAQNPAITTSGNTKTISDRITYTVMDQFNDAMGAGICLDETVNDCHVSHTVPFTNGDGGTNASGQTFDNLHVTATAHNPHDTPDFPDNFCVTRNQTITAGGCGPLIHNTIVFKKTGATLLVNNGGCNAGDACP